MCCVMGYTGHDLSAEKFKEYLLRTQVQGAAHGCSSGFVFCAVSSIPHSL